MRRRHIYRYAQRTFASADIDRALIWKWNDSLLEFQLRLLLFEQGLGCIQKTLPLSGNCLAFLKTHLFKTNTCARLGLGQPPQITTQHRGDAGIAANGLFAEQNNGLPIRRDLNIARCYRNGKQIFRGSGIFFYDLSLQAATHAVTLAAQGKAGLKKKAGLPAPR